MADRLINKDSRIYLAGHTGLLGRALLTALEGGKYTNIITAPRAKLDLTIRQQVADFFIQQKPEFVILAAARVGGIRANMAQPAEFLYDNLSIEMNVIDAAYKAGVKKLLFFGSACSYPRNCPQPMKEECLGTGPLEPTNEAYAVAKIAGIKACQSYRSQYGVNFISAIPTNMYGPGDNFDPDDSHVIPALIRKFQQAKCGGSPSVEIWGSGNQKREFIYADDVAAASLFLMENYDHPAPVNIGAGREITIKELAGVISEAVGYRGKVFFDASKPDGAPRKLLDTSKLSGMGWKAHTGLGEGIKKTYLWYLDNQRKGVK